jgi:hypothetical protein
MPTRFIQQLPFAFCAHIMFNTFNTNSTVFDLSAGAYAGNMLLMNEGVGLNWHFELYSPGSATSYSSKVLVMSNMWWVAGNAFAHTCAVVDNNGVRYGYINGLLAGSTQGWVPPGMQRNVSYLGFSSLPWNSHFNGSLE